MNLVDSVTITIPACTPKYIFQIELSDLEMERLSEDRILGIRFKKNKYQFLNDIAQVLAGKILEHLERITP